MEAQHYNKLGCIAIGIMGRASACQGPRVVSEEVMQALRWVQKQLQEAVPRNIGLSKSERPIAMYTDGSSEGVDYTDVSIGGIIFDPLLTRPEFFSHKLENNVVKKWQSTGRKQNVYLAEILPVVVSKKVWAAQHADRACVYLVDNMAATAALVGSSASDPIALALLWKALDLDLQGRCRSWYSWIPSASNAADALSRGKCVDTAQLCCGTLYKCRCTMLCVTCAHKRKECQVSVRYPTRSKFCFALNESAVAVVGGRWATPLLTESSVFPPRANARPKKQA
eukprot:4598612-Amphidinium_carterae.1